MARFDAKDPALDPKEKTRLRRRVDREWSPYLTPAEVKVLTFIFTTTVEWSKPQDRLKVDHFITGLRYARGVGLSDKTIRDALNSLDCDGAISRKRTPYGYIIRILFDWAPDAVRDARTRAVVSRKPTPLAAVPSVLLAEIPEEIGNSYRSRSVKITDAYIEEGNTREEIPSNRPAGAAALPRIPRKLPQKRNAYVDPLDKGKLRALFTEITAEAFPDNVASPWGQREEMQACAFVNVADKAKRNNALEVFTWSVREWRFIVKAQFGWMRESPPPEFPAIGFMVRFRDQFYAAWNDRERLRLDREAIGDARAMRKLVHSGLTSEEARAKIAKGNREADLRDQLAKARAETNRAYQLSEAKDRQRQALPLRPRPIKPAPIVPCSQTSAWRDDGF